MTKIIPSPQWLDKGTYKEPVDGDNIRVPRLEVDDATTFIDKDGSNNMTFEDAVTGSKTLAQLATVGVTNFADLDDVKVVHKSADQIVNNSTTLVNDTHLFFAVGANEVWWFSIFLRTKSGTTPDFKWAFTAPDGATITSGACCGVGGSPVNELSGLTGFNFSGTGANAVKDWWNIAIIAGTAGNIQFQWAQNTANASDTKVLANSCIIAHRLA